MKIARHSKAAAAAVALLVIGTVAVSAGRSSPRPATLRARLASATTVAVQSNGSGYWLVAADGGVFTFGSAHYYGSLGGQHLNSPITGIIATADGHGYWLVAKDGGVFNFGNAPFVGSMGGQALAAEVVGLASSAGSGSGIAGHGSTTLPPSTPRSS